MKRASILLSVLVFSTTMIWGQTAGPRFVYSKEVIDLGTLYTAELDVTKLSIEFTNQGDQPLVVSQVRGCCGTRVTKFTSEPINPKGKGTISVEFRLAPRAQNISRTVTATSNDPEATKIIRIVGKVVEGENPGK